MANQDPVKKKADSPAIAVKKPVKKTEPEQKLMKTPLRIEPKGPSIDSVRAAKKLMDSPMYKGKTIDPTQPGTNKRLKRLMAEHVVPMVQKNKPVADSIYSANKLKNPDYEGVSAKELDPHTKGEGKQTIESNEVYQTYRKIASPKKLPTLKGTPQVQKEKAVPKFDGGKGGKETLYVTDTLMSKSPAIKVKKK